MFYVGCHRPTTILLFYPGLGQIMNDVLIELSIKLSLMCDIMQNKFYLQRKRKKYNPKSLYALLCRTHLSHTRKETNKPNVAYY